MKIVNGYDCRTQCDVVLAKKGIDPAHPHDPPGEARRAGSPSDASDEAPQPGENHPAATGSVGTVLRTYL